MAFVASDDPSTKFPTSRGSVEYFPTSNFKLPVDIPTVINNGTVPKDQIDSIVPAIEWTINRYGVQKSSLMVLDLLATFDWKRPIYFASTSGNSTFMGLQDYLQLEGLAYRLVPVKKKGNGSEMGSVNTTVMYDNLMNKFKFGNINNTSLYFDQTVLGMAYSIRMSFARLGSALALEGKKDSAIKVLDKCQEMLPGESVPYNYYEFLVGEAYYKAGAFDKGNKIMNRLTDLYEQDLKYYFLFKGSKAESVSFHKEQSLAIMNRVAQSAGFYQQNAVAKRAKEIFERYYGMYTR